MGREGTREKRPSPGAGGSGGGRPGPRRSCFGHRQVNPWPVAVPSKDCSGIRGSYSNAGDAADRHEATELTRFIFGNPSNRKSVDAQAQATHVSIDFVSPTVLEVSAWEGETLLA